MTRRTTLLGMAVAAMVGLCGLAMLNNSSIAQNLTPVEQIQIAQPPNVQLPKVQPPNAQPLPIQLGKDGPGGPNIGGGKFNGPIPNAGAPVEYKTKEGKKGWKVVIPGNRPLATPAVVDGKVLIGGGFGSYEFYCLDAKSGKQHWVYRTGDDGPTAAVVSDGYVAFNTESCEIEIITMEGKKVWKKWLGDPLMSMPAIADGKVYQSYPAGGKHHIACFDLKNGKQFWTKDLPSQIVTAPIISKGKLYATTLDGSMTCMEARDGTLVWQDKKNATSAPVVFNGNVYFSRREVVKATDNAGKQFDQQTEAISAKGPGKTSPVKDFQDTKHNADYLDGTKRDRFSDLEKQAKSYDASVGFGAAPGGAGLAGGKMNIGQGTVNGVWAYQGSKPFVYNNLLYTSMGDKIKCVDPKTEKVKWQKDLRRAADDKKPVVDACLTPPAIVNGKMFMGTTAGQILCMSSETGETLWTATVEGPILFQPAVANGMVYVSTNNGTLYAIETGDAKDHGWLMWGANAAHNGGID